MATDLKNRTTTQRGQAKSRTHLGSKELTQQQQQGMLSFIPEKFRDAIAVVLLFLSLLIFFGKVLDSTHTFNAGDNIASESFKPFVEKAAANGQNVPQWIPNIFSGMPAFAGLVVTGNRTYDLAHEIFDMVQAIPTALVPNHADMTNIWHYFILGLGMYLLLRVTRRTSRLAAFFGALSAIFSTWVITYVMIGHNTKIFAVMTMPYIFMGIEKLRDRDIRWQGMVFWSAVLAVSFHFLLESTHMQMAFYIFLAILIYFVYSLIADLIKKQNVMPLIRSGVLALVMVGIAFAMSADRYLSTLGYEPYSIRGSAPIVKEDGTKANSSTGVDKNGGLDWNYATQWSFSPEEVITFLVPAWYGFGKLPAGNNSGLQIDADTRIPTYWGQMNGTDAANYTGIIVLFFGVIAILTLWKKDRLVGPLAIISLFAVLLSFGGNMPILFGPMFHSFPVFNKFRAPMMVLVLMQLSFPILAALCLDNVIRVWKSGDAAETAKLEKAFKYGIYAAGALLVVLYVASGFGSSIRSGIDQSGKYSSFPEQARDAIKNVAVSAATTDILVCMLIAAAGCALVYFFLRRKISPLVLGVSIVALTVIDLWRVDYRPLEVTTRDSYASNFTSHDYVDFIKQDKSTYRILDANNSMSNVPVSWDMQTIAGYHAAKMREYQDVVDVTGNGQGNVIFNPFMWNLLNTKYIIANGALSEDQTRFIPVFQSSEPAERGQRTIVWQNPQVLPRVFLVNRYEVKQPLDILHAMHDGTFNPRDVVYFDKQPSDIGQLATAPVDTTRETAQVTSYKNEEIEIKTNTAGDRLMFMSDTWYPDWTAKIDGKETPIYKANYAFRAIKVPAGAHTVTMSYYDSRYAQGKSVSLITNILALAGLVIGVGAAVSQKKKPKATPEITTPAAKEAEAIEA